jgi:hypothetical protein
MRDALASPGRNGTAVLAVSAAALVALCLAAVTGARSPGQAPRSDAWTPALRADALRRAAVWRPPSVPIEHANFETGPLRLTDEIDCRFVVNDVGGTAPKFDCELPTGEIVKIKYSGAEPYGEVASSRLLIALGFGADRVAFVRRLRCHGCPWFPFATMKAVDLARARGVYRRVVNYRDVVEFEWVAIERKFDGEPIETAEHRGWGWYETGQFRDAPRAHVDALRLLAVFLAHWDNKPDNQRLVCLPGGGARQGRCRQPFAIIQDLGATFGPRKVDLEGWRAAPIWHDRPSCQVSMESMPHAGSTFEPGAISEDGRRFLGARLSTLTDGQIEALFRAARFEAHDGAIADWVSVFKAKVSAIVEGPSCPS